jgi:hypothetical protein
MSSTEAWLKLAASMVVSGEKLGGDTQIGQPTCWGYSREFLFLGSSEIRPNMLATRKRLLYTNYVKYVWMRVIRRLSMESL